MSAGSLIVTTSWDDGHPADIKLAELLAKHHVAGTFFVPGRNREGRDVVDNRDLRSIAKQFEIGAHTLDHIDLTTVSNIEAGYQIKAGKAWLEDALGSRVLGFCYPRGAHTRSISTLTRESGFVYARTIVNFHMRMSNDRFHFPTTLQFYPHRRSTYLRNYASGGAYVSRSTPFSVAMTEESIAGRVMRLAELCARRGLFFHLWGHSWEIEENGLWKELDAVLSFLSAITGRHATNLQAVQSIIPPSP